MKTFSSTIVLSAAAMALAVLLLAGCQEGNHTGVSFQKKKEPLAPATIDTSTFDKEPHKQAQKYEALNPDSLMGSWQWLHTYCSIGNLSCKVNWCMVLRFEDGNKLSVDFNGKTIVGGANYTLKEAEENPYGEYLITVPEEVCKVVFEHVGDMPEAILNGYACFTTINNKYEMKCLVITDTEGTGRKNLHQSSTFRRVDEEHPARPLRWWSEREW